MSLLTSNNLKLSFLNKEESFDEIKVDNLFFFSFFKRVILESETEVKEKYKNQKYCLDLNTCQVYMYNIVINDQKVNEIDVFNSRIIQDKDFLVVFLMFNSERSVVFKLNSFLLFNRLVKVLKYTFLKEELDTLDSGLRIRIEVIDLNSIIQTCLFTYKINKDKDQCINEKIQFFKETYLKRRFIILIQRNVLYNLKEDNYKIGVFINRLKIMSKRMFFKRMFPFYNEEKLDKDSLTLSEKVIKVQVSKLLLFNRQRRMLKEIFQKKTEKQFFFHLKNGFFLKKLGFLVKKDFLFGCFLKKVKKVKKIHEKERISVEIMTKTMMFSMKTMISTVKQSMLLKKKRILLENDFKKGRKFDFFTKIRKTVTKTKKKKVFLKENHNFLKNPTDFPCDLVNDSKNNNKISKIIKNIENTLLNTEKNMISTPKASPFSYINLVKSQKITFFFTFFKKRLKKRLFQKEKQQKLIKNILTSLVNNKNDKISACYLRNNIKLMKKRVLNTILYRYLSIIRLSISLNKRLVILKTSSLKRSFTYMIKTIKNNLEDRFKPKENQLNLVFSFKKLIRKCDLRKKHKTFLIFTTYIRRVLYKNIYNYIKDKRNPSNPMLKDRIMNEIGELWNIPVYYNENEANEANEPLEYPMELTKVNESYENTENSCLKKKYFHSLLQYTRVTKDIKKYLIEADELGI